MDFGIENHELTSYWGNVQKVTVPDTVTKIGNNTFCRFYSFPGGECYAVGSVVIPDSVISIEEGAFS